MPPLMREVYVHHRLVILAIALSAASFAASGCKKSAPDDGTTDTDAGNDQDASFTTPANNECRDINPVHRVRECDICTRDRCCGSVLKCENAPECKNLRLCIQACQKNDITCNDQCNANHPTGQSLFNAVDSC